MYANSYGGIGGHNKLHHHSVHLLLAPAVTWSTVSHLLSSAEPLHPLPHCIKQKERGRERREREREDGERKRGRQGERKEGEREREGTVGREERRGGKRGKVGREEGRKMEGERRAKQIGREKEGEERGEKGRIICTPPTHKTDRLIYRPNSHENIHVLFL